MAKIVSSEAAPPEAVHYSLGQAEFDLGGNKAKSFETDEQAVVAAALDHPWLNVEFEEVEIVQGAYVDLLAPQDDHLSVAGQEINPNDPEEARKAEEAKAQSLDNPVAIESGLDQAKPVEEGHVALTLAADDTSKTSDKVGDN